MNTIKINPSNTLTQSLSDLWLWSVCSGGRQKLFGLMLPGLMVAIVFVMFVASAAGQEKSDMPWFDAGTGKVKPTGMQGRLATTPSDRNSIPPYAEPKDTTKSNNGTTSTGGANFGGPVSGAEFGSVLSGVTWGLAVLGGLLIVCLLIWAFLRMRSSDSQEEFLVPQRSLEESIKELPFELESDEQGDFRSLAYRLYQQGDLRKAMILLFSHVLVSLDQKGFVRLRKGKTNRQYLRELDPYQSLNGYFGQVMVRFEEAFFGDREIEQASFESCWNQLDAFQAGLESTQIRTEI